MHAKQLSIEEIKELKRRKRPAVSLGLIFFAFISLVNFAIYYRDILERREVITSRPIEQLLIVEFFSVFIAWYAYYFFSKSFRNDIRNGYKNIKEKKVTKKYIKNKEQNPEYILIIGSSEKMSVDKDLYNSLELGGIVKLHEAPLSNHLFSLEV